MDTNHILIWLHLLKMDFNMCMGNLSNAIRCGIKSVQMFEVRGGCFVEELLTISLNFVYTVHSCSWLTGNTNHALFDLLYQ